MGMRRTMMRFVIWPSERLAAQSRRWSFAKRHAYQLSLTAATDLVARLCMSGCDVCSIPDLELPLVHGVFVCSIQQDGDVIRVAIDDYDYDGPDDDGDDDPPRGGKPVEGIVACLEIDGRVSELIIEHGTLIRVAPTNSITATEIVKSQNSEIPINVFGRDLLDKYIFTNSSTLSRSQTSRFGVPVFLDACRKEAILRSAAKTSAFITSPGNEDRSQLIENDMPSPELLDSKLPYRSLLNSASEYLPARILH
jgi:hypothetical protein